MMSKIKQMSMKDIVEKIGFPANLEEFKNTYKYNISEEKVKKFEKDIIILSQTGKQSFQDYLKIILENEQIFDKEIYFLHITILLEQEYSEEFLGKKKRIQKVFNLNNNENDLIKKSELIKFCKRILSTIDVVDITVSNLDENEIYYTVKSSLEFADNETKWKKRKEKTKEQLEKIETLLGLDNVISLLFPEDLKTICRYENLGNILEKEVKTTFDFFEKEDNVKNKKTQEELKKIIVRNANYIDLDKMLLLANTLFFYKKGNNLEDFNEDELRRLKLFTETVEMLVTNKKISFTSPRFVEKINKRKIEEFIQVLNKHFINGKFYNTTEIKELSQKILNGSVNISILTKEEFINAMDFSDEDLNKIILASDNAIEYFLENGIETEQELKQRILSLDKINSNILISAILFNIITADEFLKMYSLGKIDIKEIKKIKNKLKDKKDFEKIVSSKKLIELYLIPSKKKEFESYKKIYKILKIEGKTIKQREKIANEILDYSLDLLEEKNILDLYHNGLIPIETVINIFGDESLKKLYIQNEILPMDARRLFDEKILTNDDINEILINDDLSIEEKLVLIFSTFSKLEDEKIVKKFLSNIKNENLNNIVNLNPEEKVSNENKKLLEEFEEKYIIQIRRKWNFIMQKDLEYSQKYFNNGYIVFYLPNKGKYILEKIFFADTKVAYGSATYIFTKDEFENNINLICEKASNGD